MAAAAPALLRVRAVDPSGAVVPHAEVTLRCAGHSPFRARTSASGQAAFAVAEASACTAVVEARGFEPAVLASIAPDAQGVVTVPLLLARREEAMIVDADSRADLARERSFSQVMTPEEIDSLPDDPEEMEDELRRRAGPGAVLRVNGFGGGRLPPKSQIRAIRIQTNRYAAEYHEGGHPGIDIVTKPGLGSWRTGIGGGLRDGAWSARPPLASARASEGAHRLSLTLEGPLRKDKTSLSLQFQSRAASDREAVTALSAGAPPTVSTTQDKLDLQARLEHAWGGAQTLRAEVQHDTFDRDGLGTGGLALPERAYAEDRAEDFFRLSNAGVVFGSWATDTRLQVRREAVTWTPRTNGPAIEVMGAFSSGGATLSGRRDTWRVELGQDFARSIGKHSVKAGLLYEGARVRSDERRNQAGTYTFAGLDDWEAGRPLLFSQRRGDPRVTVDLHRIGLYAQDDWRPAEDLAVHAGLRYEAQTLVSGFNLGPRLGLTWAVRPGLTLRAGGGRFFEWLEADTVAQVRAGDGSGAQEFSMESPAWPEAPGASSATSTPRLWAFAPVLVQPRVSRVSFGLERSFGGLVRLNAGYQYERGDHLLRALNRSLDTGRLFEVRPEGRLRVHSVRMDAMVGAPGRRGGVMVGYIFRHARNDGDDALTLPAGLDLDGEWGPARDDGHRIFGMGHSRLVGRLRASGQVFAQSGSPWEVTTGRDDNGDTVPNDRPAGVGRNAERGAWTVDLGVRLAWDFGFGGPRAGPRGPQVVAIRIGGGDGPPDIGGPDEQRYALQLYALARNALNRLNPIRYGSVLGSPLYATPVAALPGRRIELGARFRF
jgi:hypothetical protein